MGTSEVWRNNNAPIPPMIWPRMINAPAMPPEVAPARAITFGWKSLLLCREESGRASGEQGEDRSAETDESRDTDV